MKYIELINNNLLIILMVAVILCIISFLISNKKFEKVFRDLLTFIIDILQLISLFSLCVIVHLFGKWLVFEVIDYTSVINLVVTLITTSIIAILLIIQIKIMDIMSKKRQEKVGKGRKI